MLQKKCITCHHQYFLDKGFKFKPDVWNKCHDLLMFMNLNNIAILNIPGIDYRRITNGINKCEAVNSIQNAKKVKKADHYKT